MTGGLLGKIARWIQPVFVLIAVAFIGFLLYSHWPELRAQEWQVNWGWLALSTVLLLIAWAIEVYIWRNLLGAFDGQMGWWDTLRIWFISAIIRYIPGNVWQPLSITLFCYRKGVRPESTLAAIVLFQVVTLLGTLPVGAFYVYLVPPALRPEFLVDVPGPALLALMLAPLLVFLFNPAWMMTILNWLLRKARRGEIPGNLSRGRLAWVFFVAILTWIFWGTSFAAMTFTLGEYSPDELVILTLPSMVVYPIAYAIGFVSFLTPSGFGVREGALIVLLSPYLSLPVITIVALVHRLWIVVLELVAAGGALLYDRLHPERDADDLISSVAHAAAEGAAENGPGLVEAGDGRSEASRAQ